MRWLVGGGKHGEPHAALTFSSTVALRYGYGTGKLPGARVVQPTFDTVQRGVDIDVHEITLHLGSGIYF